MPEITKRMDRAEVSKRIEHAGKLLQKGKTADALGEYLQVLASDPGNDAVRQMAADLYLSLQRIPEAANLLGDLFERQVQAGDATRASLTYKKLARFASPTWQQKVRFGQLLENSNRKLAVETYETSLEGLAKSGDMPNALLVLKRIVALEPTSENLQRLGKLAAGVGDSKTAAQAYQRLGQLAESSGSDPASWYERAYSEDSTNPQVALSYGRSLLTQGQAGAAIFVLEPLLSIAPEARDLREVYGDALLAANRLSGAEPFIWEQFERNPARLPDVAKLIGLFIDAQQDAEAIALAHKLEAVQRRRGNLKAFAAMMQDIAASHRPSPDILEFLSELFNASNREGEYAQTLLKLFDLHYSAGNYAKAAECFDRAADVDAYEPGHQRRLESLRGKIDDGRFRVIASRFAGVQNNAPEPQRGGEPVLGATALQDLMLQAEILVQYGMRAKAVERLQRIQEMFPGEETRNEDLHRLYLSAGVTPPPLEVPETRPPEVPASGPARQGGPAAAPVEDVTNLTKVAEISRKLYREGHAEGVLKAAVQEIGTMWKLGRCVAVLRRRGQRPTAVVEHCSEGQQPGNTATLSKVALGLQELAMGHGSLTIASVPATPELQAISPLLDELAAVSLVVMPLADGKEQMGVLALMDSTPRIWSQSDVVILKSLSEQIVIALKNAGLRRLVKDLSVTDDDSGLLKRASYLDLLLGEARRALQQKTPVSVLLMQFGAPASLMKEAGEAAVDAMMQHVGQLVSANMRQNDLAFRYETTTVALLLGETAEKEAQLAVEKLRKLMAEVRLPGHDETLLFSAGIAQAVVAAQYDPVDIVTEVINRAENALAAAVQEGFGQTVSLSPALAAAAVA